MIIDVSDNRAKPDISSLTGIFLVKEVGGVERYRLVKSNGNPGEVIYTTGLNESGVIGVTLEDKLLDEFVEVVIGNSEIPILSNDNENAIVGDALISDDAGNGLATHGRRIKDGSLIHAVGQYTDVFNGSSGTPVPHRAWFGRIGQFERVRGDSREIKNGADTGNLSVEGTTDIQADTGNMTFTLPDGNYDGQVKDIILTDATFYADVTISNTIDGTSNVYRLNKLSMSLNLVWRSTRWEFIEPSTGRQEVVTDSSTTARSGGTTIFKNTGASDFTLTIPDGDFDGQRKLIIGDQGSTGNLNVSVTNHVLSSPYTTSMRGNGSSVEFVWSSNLGKWTTLVPVGSDSIATGNTARFTMTMSGGSKFQPANPTLAQGTPNDVLKMDGVDLDFISPGSKILMSGGLIDLEDGDIVSNPGNVINLLDGVDVRGSLLVQDEIQAGDAGNTIVIAGITATPQFNVNTQDFLGVGASFNFAGTSSTLGSNITLNRSRGSLTVPAIIQAGDRLGTYSALGHDGTDWVQVAHILMKVQTGSTPADNDIEGQIELSVSPGGGTSPQPAVTIHSDKRVELEEELQSKAGRVKQTESLAVNTTLTGDHHHVAVTAAGVTITLPASPENGREYFIQRVHAGSPSSISGNGKNINGSASVNLTVNYMANHLVYYSSAGQWILQ